ncbi:class F sortase [Priestia megaterium]|nr:class F sortase [Priestia megaterium]
MKTKRWVQFFTMITFFSLIFFSRQMITAAAQPETRTGNAVETKSATQADTMLTANSINISAPSQLSIPKLHIRAFIEKANLNSDGQMTVSDNGKNVVWFEPGTKPGNEGNAVIAGHVDNKTGPAVFYNLGKLEKGDKVFVSDLLGNILTFTVIDKATYPRNDAPMRKIFGPTFNHQLNLITCAGLFDQKHQTHEERLVVYTELQQVKAAHASH